MDAFVESCLNATRFPDPQERVHRLLEELISEPAKVRSVLGEIQPDHSRSAQYQFLYQSSELTVLHVVTPGLFRSPPHNHLAWVVVGMYEGAERHTFYRRVGDRLVQESVKDTFAPQLIVLDPDAIHGIANPLATPSRGLHVYGGTLANPARSLWNPFTLQEQPFELAELSRYENLLNPDPTV